MYGAGGADGADCAGKTFSSLRLLEPPDSVDCLAAANSSADSAPASNNSFNSLSCPAKSFPLDMSAASGAATAIATAIDIVCRPPCIACQSANLTFFKDAKYSTYFWNKAGSVFSIVSLLSISFCLAFNTAFTNSDPFSGMSTCTAFIRLKFGILTRTINEENGFLGYFFEGGIRTISSMSSSGITCSMLTFIPVGRGMKPSKPSFGLDVPGSCPAVEQLLQHMGLLESPQ